MIITLIVKKIFQLQVLTCSTYFNLLHGSRNVDLMSTQNYFSPHVSGSVTQMTFSTFSQFEMKRQVFFLVFSLILAQPIFGSVAVSIVETIKQSFKSNSVVDLLTFGDKSEKLANNILSLIGGSVVTRVKSFRETNLWDGKFHAPTILLFDSDVKFISISNNITWKTIPMKNHFVYAPKLKVEDLTKIEDGFSIDHVSFLITNQKNGLIELVTSFLFTRHACRESQFVTINTFNVKSMSWINSTFYPKKYENFYKCELKIGIFDTGTHTPTTHSNGTVTATGHTVEIINELSKFFNFQIRFEVCDIVEFLTQLQKGSLDKKYSSIDLMATPLPNDLLNYEGVIMSNIFMSEEHLFFVPPGEPYTQLEKMFLIYDLEVWIAILVFLVGGLCIIQILKLMSKRFQKIFVGSNVNTPSLNLVEIFLVGGLSSKIPRGFYSKFIFVLFMIWSLIIRTCYQSELFKYLQKDMRRRGAETFDDLHKMNFNIYGGEEILKTYYDPKQFKDVKDA